VGGESRLVSLRLALLYYALNKWNQKRPDRGTDGIALDNFSSSVQAVLTAKLFCSCQVPFEEGVDMVSCYGGCDGWFHPRCVGLSEAEAQQPDSFLCPTCAEGK
jgi:hypothetical protein